MNSGSDTNAAQGSIYSSLDVAEMTGVSLRQLQWWDEQGVVTPLQKGRRRLYSPTEVLLVSVIMGLRRKKLSLQKIRKIVERLKGNPAVADLAAQPSDSDVYLLTDGDRVSLQVSPQSIINLQVASQTPMTLLCLSDLVRRLGWTQDGTPRKPLRIETGRASGQQPLRTAKAIAS